MKHILISISIILTLTSFAQEDIPYNVSSAIPPSPTSASLGKYGDVPVGLYTGIPSISIPIYNITEGNLSVPISITYHSQGFKVAEEASWIGLGWSLNAGGTITRAVKGAPDDFNGDYWGVNLETSGGSAGSNGFLISSTTIDNLCNGTTPLSDYYMNATSSNTFDGEPDVFFFNFPGGSGQFMFDKLGNIQLFSQQNLKFNYFKNSSNDIIKFEIIDGNGNTYTFDEIETTKTESMINNDFYVANFGQTEAEELSGVFSASDFVDDMSPYNSSWHLTQIKNATNNHQINFSYTSEYQKIISGISVQYKYKQTDNARETTCNGLSITAKRLSQITWSKGSIVFSATINREDLNGLSVNTPPLLVPLGNAKALSDIQIKDVNNTLIKKYNFNYSYFLAPNSSGAGDKVCLYKKLKLLSLTEQNSLLSISNPPYLFEYDETVAMAPKFSQRQDFWGYLKTTPAPSNLYTPKVYSYPNDPIDNDFLSEFSIYPRPTGTPVILGNYDKSPEVIAMKNCIIKKITYPTKGTTTFEFEPHDFYLQSQTRIGGGLRIKTIIDYDGIDHANDIIKNYSYKQSANPTITSGKVLTLPVFAKRTSCVISNNLYNLSLFNNSIAGLGTTLGSYVGYTEVTVEYNGNGKTLNKFYLPAYVGVSQDECALGTCLYNRTTSNIYLSGSFNYYPAGNLLCFKDNFPFTENPNYDWNRGALLEELVYDNQNRLVKKTVNVYTIKDTKKINAFANSVVRRSLATDGLGQPDNSFVYRYAKHYYISAWKVLTQQTVTEYDVNNPTALITNSSNYYYDNPNHKQLTKTIVSDSKGINYETSLKRCLDFVPTTGFLSTLNSQNRLNEVIEQQQWVYDYGTTTKRLIGASFTEYKDFSTQNSLPTSQLLPVKSYNLETASPILESAFVPTTFSGSTFNIDTRFKPSNELNFDNKDNLIKKSIFNAGLKNNSTNIFGHNKTLLIAQVNNANEADCGFTSFESDDQNLWTINTPVTLITNDGHCGTQSRLIPPNTFGPTRNFVPSTDAQNKKFILSCWIKTNSSATGSIGSLVLTSVNPITGAMYPSVSGSYMVTTLNNTNNTWQYIEVEIDLKQIKNTAGLPLSTTLGIGSFIWNQNATVNIQVDDIRFYPKEARMSTFTYIPAVGASSVSDENSNCQFYEYDTFGRLKIVKDQFGRILEKTDYNYKP